MGISASYDLFNGILNKNKPNVMRTREDERNKIIFSLTKQKSTVSDILDELTNTKENIQKTIDILKDDPIGNKTKLLLNFKRTLAIEGRIVRCGNSITKLESIIDNLRTHHLTDQMAKAEVSYGRYNDSSQIFTEDIIQKVSMNNINSAKHNETMDELWNELNEDMDGGEGNNFDNIADKMYQECLEKSNLLLIEKLDNINITGDGQVTHIISFIYIYLYIYISFFFFF